MSLCGNVLLTCQSLYCMTSTPHSLMSTCSLHDPVSDLVASLLPEEIRGRHENKRNTSTTTAHSKVAEHIYLVATILLASIHIHTPGQVRWSRSCKSNSIFAWHNLVCVGDQQQRLFRRHIAEMRRIVQTTPARLSGTQ